MSELNVAVFGGGSVGLCLAAHFAKAGAQTSLLLRSSSIEALQGKPIEVSGALGDHSIGSDMVSLCDAANPTAEVLNSDMLVLTTKAHDVETALQPFRQSSTCPPVLLLQNGMGAAEIARDVLGPDVPLFSTAMMIGMVRRSANEVAVTAQASPINCGALLGDDPTPLKKMLKVATKGFVPMAYDETIRETISFKLLFNSCMNPTGALTGQTYGELLKDPNSRAFITRLADETLAAFASAYNYAPATDGKHYVEEVLSPIVFPRGEGHHSSMLQDLQASRRTEIDFLNGAVVRLAKREGLSAARHEGIIQLIKAREALLLSKAQN